MVESRFKNFVGYFKIARYSQESACGGGPYLTSGPLLRHYKWALTQMFEQRGFDSVIILEDDLDIAPVRCTAILLLFSFAFLSLLIHLPTVVFSNGVFIAVSGCVDPCCFEQDFFEYMTAGKQLLQEDPTLWCVSGQLL